MKRRSVLTGGGLAGGLLLAGCAGFRGGWESVPYVGETPPEPATSRSTHESVARRELRLPGVTLNVHLRNVDRTWDTQVWFFVVPVMIDPRTRRHDAVEPGMTQIGLSVSGLAAPAVLHARLARLLLDGRVTAASAGLEFARWDAEGRPSRTEGLWEHRPLPEGHRLAPGPGPHLLRLDFPVAAPDPQATGTVLDLSDALRIEGQPALPPICFQPQRWRGAYG